MFLLNPISNSIVAAMMALAAAAAISDIRGYRIPNLLNLAILALYPVYVIAHAGPIDWPLALVIALGAFVIALVLFMFGFIGGGDAKMMTVMALWAGPDLIIDFIFIMSIAGAVIAIVMLTSARHALALACESVGQWRLRQVLLGDVLPYGIAVAAGGIFVGIRLLQV